MREKTPVRLELWSFTAVDWGWLGSVAAAFHQNETHERRWIKREFHPCIC